MGIFISILIFTIIIQILIFVVLIASKFLIPVKKINLIINNEEPKIIDSNQNLLNALFSENIFIPSACGGKGTCGYCKVKVNSGGGAILPTEIDQLTRKEKKNGIRLACQIRVMEDLNIEIPEDLMSAKIYETKCTSSKNLTHDIKELTFTFPSSVNFEFNCGNYVQIQIPNEDSPDGYVFRAYSIASSQFETNSITLNVKLIEGGIGSTWLHNLNQKDSVILTGPYGEWTLSSDTSRELILIGGGVGMAPMRSIIQSSLKLYPEKKVRFFFGARTEKDLFYSSEFNELEKENPNFSYIPALSDIDTKSEWSGETGFIHKVFEKHFNLSIASEPDFFLCGPPPMIEATIKLLTELKIQEENIFYDKF